MLSAIRLLTALMVLTKADVSFLMFLKRSPFLKKLSTLMCMVP